MERGFCSEQFTNLTQAALLSVVETVAKNQCGPVAGRHGCVHQEPDSNSHRIGKCDTIESRL